MVAQRKIIHVDMDCFYAAVEVRDDSTLRNKPVAIGGSRVQRGVLSTCNYEARQYGLHSAMATAHALRLCPDLVLLPVNMQKYCAASKAIRQIFRKYTDIIEPLSLDEAFMDVSNCEQYQGSATLIAQAIRQDIKSEQNLTASAGVASNKFLAKIASDWNKPDGIFVITPDQIENFMKNLPVQKIFGVGKATVQKLFDRQIKTCGDLQQLSLLELIQSFGSFGAKLHDLCRGIDDRSVEIKRERKSLSVEKTYPSDLKTPEVGCDQLKLLFERLTKRLFKLHDNPIVSKAFVKIKFHDFTHTTVECVLREDLMIEPFVNLFLKGYARYRKPIRLIGLGVRFKPAMINVQEQFDFVN